VRDWRSSVRYPAHLAQIGETRAHLGQQQVGGFVERRRQLSPSKNARDLASGSSMRSCTFWPAMRHSSASGLSREPPQAVQGVYARYRDSNTRTCIL
jgi:hypothetical protein